MPVSPRIRRSVLTAIMLMFMTLFPSVAAGQSTPAATPEAPDGPSFVLRPLDDVDGSYFTLEAAAGSSQTLEVVVGNADDTPLTLRTYVADGFTLINGGFGTKEESEPLTGTATWLTYEAATLTLESGEGVEREIGVAIPDGTAPGQYIAGVVLQTAEPITVEGSSFFKQTIRKSVAIFITVPGPTTPAMELGEPTIQGETGSVLLVVPISNTGNVLLKPAGELTLTDSSGNEIFGQQISMNSVYAGMDTTLEIPLPSTIPDGDYQVTLSLSDDASDAEASLDQVALALVRGTASEAPISLGSTTITPLPDEDDVQFASVSVTIENRDIPLNGAQVVLNVRRDGEVVEDFLLASAVTLQQGETVLEQRYLPITGWTAGEWTFSVTLESVDPTTGAKTTILSTEVDQSISISEP